MSFTALPTTPVRRYRTLRQIKKHTLRHTPCSKEALAVSRDNVGSANRTNAGRATRLLQALHDTRSNATAFVVCVCVPSREFCGENGLARELHAIPRGVVLHARRCHIPSNEVPSEIFSTKGRGQAQRRAMRLQYCMGQ